MTLPHLLMCFCCCGGGFFFLVVGILEVDCVNVLYVCCKLERALSHFALLNPFSVCLEIKYV